MTLKQNKVHEVAESVVELEFKTDFLKLEKLASYYINAQEESRLDVTESKTLKRAKYSYKSHVIQMRKKYGSNPLYAEYNEMIISNSTLSRLSHQTNKTDNVSDDSDKSKEEYKQKEHKEHRKDTNQQSIGVAA